MRRRRLLGGLLLTVLLGAGLLAAAAAWRLGYVPGFRLGSSDLGLPSVKESQERMARDFAAETDAAPAKPIVQPPAAAPSAGNQGSLAGDPPAAAKVAPDPVLIRRLAAKVRSRKASLAGWEQELASQDAAIAAMRLQLSGDARQERPLPHWDGSLAHCTLCRVSILGADMARLNRDRPDSAELWTAKSRYDAACIEEKNTRNKLGFVEGTRASLLDRIGAEQEGLVKAQAALEAAAAGAAAPAP